MPPASSTRGRGGARSTRGRAGQSQYSSPYAQGKKRGAPATSSMVRLAAAFLQRIRSALLADTVEAAEALFREADRFAFPEMPHEAHRRLMAVLEHAKGFVLIDPMITPPELLSEALQEDLARVEMPASLFSKLAANRRKEKEELEKAVAALGAAVARKERGFQASLHLQRLLLDESASVEALREALTAAEEEGLSEAQRALTTDGRGLLEASREMVTFRTELREVEEELELGASNRDADRLAAAIQRAVELGLEQEMDADKQLLDELCEERRLAQGLRTALDARDLSTLVQLREEAIAAGPVFTHDEMIEAAAALIDVLRAEDALLRADSIAEIQKALKAAEAVTGVAEPVLAAAREKLDQRTRQLDLEKGIATAIVKGDQQLLQEMEAAAEHLGLPFQREKARRALRDMEMIAIKCNWQAKEDLRTVQIARGATLAELVGAVSTRYGGAKRLYLKYKDAVGDLIRICEDDDLRLELDSLEVLRWEVYVFQEAAPAPTPSPATTRTRTTSSSRRSAPKLPKAPPPAAASDPSARRSASKLPPTPPAPAPAPAEPATGDGEPPEATDQESPRKTNRRRTGLAPAGRIQAMSRAGSTDDSESESGMGLGLAIRGDSIRIKKKRRPKGS